MSNSCTTMATDCSLTSCSCITRVLAPLYRMGLQIVVLGLELPLLLKMFPNALLMALLLSSLLLKARLRPTQPLFLGLALLLLARAGAQRKNKSVGQRRGSVEGCSFQGQGKGQMQYSD